MTAAEIAGKFNQANDHLTGAEYFAAAGDWLPALEAINRVHALVVDATSEIVQEAFNEGATKTAIAAALGVPASTFRGMTKTRVA